MNSVEEKIVEILFKDKLIIDILVDELLPKIKFTTEFKEDATPEMVYEIARSTIKSKLMEILK